MAQEKPDWIWTHRSPESFIADQFIDHPLLRQPVPHKRIAEICVRVVAERVTEAEWYYEYQKWDRYIQIHDPYYRSLAVLDLANRVDDVTFLRLVGNTWNDPGCVGLSSTFLASALFAVRRRADQSIHLMTLQERDEHALLSPTLTCYRSHTTGNELGPLWVPDETVAIRHARIYDFDFISTCCVKKEQVIALFSRKPFVELVLNVERVEAIETMALEPC